MSPYLLDLVTALCVGLALGGAGGFFTGYHCGDRDADRRWSVPHTRRFP